MKCFEMVVEFDFNLQAMKLVPLTSYRILTTFYGHEQIWWQRRNALYRRLRGELFDSSAARKQWTYRS